MSRRDWRFIGVVTLVIMAAALWSSLSGDLTTQEAADLVTTQISNELGVPVSGVTVFRVRAGAERTRQAAARVLGMVGTFRFERTNGVWRWTAVEPEGGAAMTVADYIGSLRGEDEDGAISALRLINTGEVSARLRTGHFQGLGTLAAAGGVLADPNAVSPRGYRVELSTDGLAYEAFVVPTAYPLSGRRSFYSNEGLALRCADVQGQPAGRDAPECLPRNSNP